MSIARRNPRVQQVARQPDGSYRPARTKCQTAICPLTRGVAPEFNAFVSARVRAIAGSVGAPAEESEQWTPNAEIIFILPR
jgi:hypothetical protein